jgi:hypothetical protein
MKYLLFVIMLFGAMILCSCQKVPGYVVKDGVKEIANLTPISCIWYKPGKTGWVSNKSWSQEEEINKIKELLIKADQGRVYTEGEYKLSLIFYDGHVENLKLWEISFTLTGKSFRGDVGSSRELGELLFTYLPERTNLVCPGVDPEKFEESQRRLREEIQRLKEKERMENEQENL